MNLDHYRIAPGAPVRLDDRATDDTRKTGRKEVEALTAETVARIDELQERLYAQGTRSLLVVLQAMDGAGKDSTIRAVFGPLNPQGIRVAAFKAPTEIEKGHDFLWRVHREAPARGEFVVFNRSHYEDVLVVRVHGWVPADEVERRYEHIRAFERLLADGATRVVKVMLHVSKAYQLERMRKRLDDPAKHWKFNPGDLEERKLWDDYMRAFEVAIEQTSTAEAPWFVVPSEKRWFRDLVVARIVLEVLEALDPQFPAPTYDAAAVVLEE